MAYIPEGYPISGLKSVTVEEVAESPVPISLRAAKQGSSIEGGMSSTSKVKVPKQKRLKEADEVVVESDIKRPIPKHRVTFKDSRGFFDTSYHKLIVSDAAICLLYDQQDVWAVFYQPQVQVDPLSIVVAGETYSVMSLGVRFDLDMDNTTYTVILLLRQEFLLNRVNDAQPSAQPEDSSVFLSSSPILLDDFPGVARR